MKKILFIASFMLIAIFAMSTNVYATGTESDPYVAKTIDELSDAFAAGGYVELGDNINVGEFTGNKLVIESDKTVTLDLKGYTLSAVHSDPDTGAALIYNKGNFVINDTVGNGKISMNGNGEGTRRLSNSVAILAILNTGNITVNGGILENKGNMDCPYVIDSATSGKNALVTINGGSLYSRAVIRIRANSTTYSSDIKINGGSINGGTAGVWIQQVNKNLNKASLVMKGGDVYGDKWSGIYADVYASTAESITMSIEGGSIGNNSEDKATISYAVPNGVAETLNGSTLNLAISDGTLYNKNAAGPIIMNSVFTTGSNEVKKDNIKVTGGTFSADVTEYIDSTLKSVKDESTGKYIVGIESMVIVKSGSNGKAQASLEKAVEGQAVKVTITPDKNYELASLKVTDKAGKAVAIKNNTFTMPASDVTIEVAFKEMSKDSTPATGSINIVFIVSSIVAIVTAGILISRRYAIED